MWVTVWVSVKEVGTELNFSTKCFLCKFSNTYFLYELYLYIYIFYLHKDFLRNIQGSIFSSDLYDKWLGVTDQGSEEEKVTAAQR